MFTKSEKDLQNEQIQQATAEEQYRKPSPLGDYKWDEEDFIEFIQEQEAKPIKLSTYRCNPTGKPKCIVIFYHGMNEHMGLYAHIAQSISKDADAIVVGMDFRGFGKSEGEPGWIESTEQHLGDCERLIELTRQLYTGLDVPYFALGQSLGGMSSYHMALKGHFKGIVLITPAIMDNEYNEYYGKLLASWIGGIFPKLRLVNYEPKHENKNPQILEEFLDDQYGYKGHYLPGTVKMIVENMKALPATFAQFQTPFLVITGGMDRLVNPQVGHTLVEQSPSVDKQLIYKENMWHNAILEEEIVDLIPQIVEWFKNRC